ncbi:hypothetical protein WICMUC_000941 [Wickerhamomyces mucosus]|uniref:Peptide:N-glycanase 1 n=1 Tax=Wickerhamomyces mucosus TaxID=1378264 RepID=A0A9P8PW93_9ASCO|nr:hypothetical protein WICMUC_000941 [Wickerhamomyces mucosus]
MGKVDYADISERLIQGYKEKLFVKQQNTLIEKQRNLGSLIATSNFGANLLNLLKTISKYEDHNAQQICLDSIDLEKIYKGVDDRMETPEIVNEIELGYSDYLVKEVLKWYKEFFFEWVNQPKTTEDQGEARLIKIERSNLKEQQEGSANVTEIYVTSKTNEIIRFPRYNDPIFLLNWKKGRCGEWNNCFCLILRSLGLRIRYIWNKEDHVWCEYYSTSLKTWIHLDCCENSFNEPLLYNKGWNKKMSYCIAFGMDGIKDVSFKYVNIEKNSLPRDQISESELCKIIKYCNSDLKKFKNKDDLFQLHVEENYEDYFYKQNNKILDDLKSRKSGDSSWTKERGEDGN